MTPSRFNVSPEWGLVMVTALWGSSFILLSLSLKGLSPGLLVALRFGGGAVLMACLLRSSLFKLKKEDWIAGCATGTCIFLGYFLQTVGLQTITSSISAFLTALYVPFVPLFQWILFTRKHWRMADDRQCRSLCHGDFSAGTLCQLVRSKSLLLYSAGYRHILEHALLHCIRRNPL